MPILKQLEKWMSTGQVSNRLDTSRQGAINLAENKRLRAVRVACGWIYDPESVEEYAEKYAEKQRRKGAK